MIIVLAILGAQRRFPGVLRLVAPEAASGQQISPRRLLVLHLVLLTRIVLRASIDVTARAARLGLKACGALGGRQIVDCIDERGRWRRFGFGAAKHLVDKRRETC